ncbi:MAG: KamA family radical SAM protein [Acidobacteriota bacterium]
MSEPTETAPAVGGEAGFTPLAEAAKRLGYAAEDWRAAARVFPVRWPEHYLRLGEGDDGAAIRKMGVPAVAELTPDPGDLADPVGEQGLLDGPCLVRKHPDRALLLVTARCHFYCRFCFRRSHPAGAHRDPTREQLDDALGLIRNDPRVREVILSGGDPLVLSDERLAEIVAAVADIDHVETLRVHSRAPVHHPQRVTPELAALLAGGKPAWLVTHFNNARELTEESEQALGLLRAAGLSLLNQTVLLSGVNDSRDELVALFSGLYRRGIKPYYLHHPDRAPGNAAFRVSLRRGRELYRDVRGRLPGPAMPSYVIDLPDGSGKVPVLELLDLGNGAWQAPGRPEPFQDIPDTEDERPTETPST